MRFGSTCDQNPVFRLIVTSIVTTLPPRVFGLAVHVLLTAFSLPVIYLLSVKSHADPVLICFKGRSAFMFMDIPIRGVPRFPDWEL